jgi:hypothetical protein
MVGRLFIAGTVLALILRVGGANADPQPEPMLVPPVSPACISSPFGPRVLANHPHAGTYHHGVDLPAPPGASIVATAPGKVIRIQKKGPGGLKSWCSTMASSPSTATWAWPPHRLLKAKEPSRRARSWVSLEELESLSARTYILRCSWPESRLIRLRICVYRNAAAKMNNLSMAHRVDRQSR